MELHRIILTFAPADSWWDNPPEGSSFSLDTLRENREKLFLILEENGENQIENKNNKKIFTNNQKSNEPSTDDENDDKPEVEEENLNIDNFLYEKKSDGAEIKNVKRRSSNLSNRSAYSKASQSTLDTSISSIQEKNNSEEKIDNLKENNTITCPDQKHQANPAFENTEILNVKVKISKDKTATFKLKRFDDLFYTIKLFCEINSVDEKLIKPLIIKSLATLNTIYQVMNSKLEEKQINVLKKMQNL